jgi:hypothetical protein
VPKVHAILRGEDDVEIDGEPEDVDSLHQLRLRHPSPTRNP